MLMGFFSTRKCPPSSFFSSLVNFEESSNPGNSFQEDQELPCVLFLPVSQLNLGFGCKLCVAPRGAKMNFTR